MISQLRDSHDQMHALARSMTREWDDTRSIWQDVMRERLEQDHIEPLQREVHQTLKAMLHVIDAFEAAERQPQRKRT